MMDKHAVGDLEKAAEVILGLTGDADEEVAAEDVADGQVVVHMLDAEGNRIQVLTHTASTVVGAGTTEELDDKSDPQQVELMDTDSSQHQILTGEEKEQQDQEGLACYICGTLNSVGLIQLVESYTDHTGTSLADRIVDSVLDTSDQLLAIGPEQGVCPTCLTLINAVDHRYQHYLEASREMQAQLIRSGHLPSPLDPSAVPEAAAKRKRGRPRKNQPSGQGQPQNPEGTASQHPSAIFTDHDYREEEATQTAGSDTDEIQDLDELDDADWEPTLKRIRSSRSRVPKPRRPWSPTSASKATRAAAVGRTSQRGVPGETQDDVTAEDGRTLHLEVRSAEPTDPAPAEPDADPDPESDPGENSTEPLPPGQQRLTAFQCRRCNINFIDSRAMVQHLKRHANKSWCRRCKKEFPSRTRFKEHKRQCRLQNTKGHCVVCKRDVDHLQQHKERHSQLILDGKLQPLDPLPVSEEPVGPARVGRRPGRSLAGGTCSICGEHVPERLKKHERAHNITHTCPICQKVFTREDVVRGHIRRVHMKERPHVCSTCGKTFVSIYSLQRHEMIHNNEYRFYCQECGDGFRQKTQLTGHMKHKHGVLDVVFEDVEVMPDTLEVVSGTEGIVYQGVLQDKDQFVIAAADDDDVTTASDLRFAALTDEAGNVYRATLSDSATGTVTLVPE